MIIFCVILPKLYKGILIMTQMLIAVNVTDRCRRLHHLHWAVINWFVLLLN
jgi:hypothetical protein